MLNFQLNMTDHANTRLQQRGIKPEVVDLILKEADKFKSCRDGATSVFVSRKKLQMLTNKKACTPQLAEKAIGVVLVHSDDAVITVFHQKNRRCRFH